MKPKPSPADVWDTILHEVALARAESRPSTPRERAIAERVRASIDALIAEHEPRERSQPMGVMTSFVEATDDEMLACWKDHAKLDELLRDRSRAQADVEKAWQGIYYLFRGKAFQFEREALDFEHWAKPMLDSDVMMVDAETMSYLKETFATDGREALLAANYQPKDMRGVYPDIWEREGNEARDYLLFWFGRLQTFIRSVRPGYGALFVMR